MKACQAGPVEPGVSGVPCMTGSSNDLDTSIGRPPEAPWEGGPSAAQHRPSSSSTWHRLHWQRPVTRSRTIASPSVVQECLLSHKLRVSAAVSFGASRLRRVINDYLPGAQCGGLQG